MTPDEWDQAERRILRAWTGGQVRDALREIELALVRGNDEVRGQALVYRGSIYEEAANWDAAQRDFIQAADLFRAGSYLRYSAELSAGLACEQAGERQQAAQWYRAALLTCAQDDERFSGATVAKAFLALQPALAPEDAELVQAVIVRSWQVLNLTGEPDLDHLVDTTETLMRRALHRDA